MTTAVSSPVSLALRVALIVFAVGALSACGDRSADSETRQYKFEPVSAASLEVGDVVPAPTGVAVLTVGDGLSGGVVFDLATLERAGMVAGELFEPFEKKRVTFTGVELKHVLAVAGVPAGTDLHLVALDEYAVDLTAADVEAGGILLATSVDGKPIPIANGGPIRVVFLDDVELGKTTDLWIWSLARIEFTL